MLPLQLSPDPTAPQRTRDQGSEAMTRYGFTIKTRHGQRVESIQIMAVTPADAERRLRQMYQHCEILERRENAVPRKVDALDVESIIGLISNAGVSPHEAVRG